MMKLCSLAGALALFSGANRAAAQAPAIIAIDTSAGVRISVAGTSGGVYVVQSTGDPGQANAWTSRSFLQISNSGNVFTDAPAPQAGSRFYRAVFSSPLTNLVFIPPNTFTLGSPTNETGRSTDESPQTAVMLSRGFWMAKFLVTQGDYLAVVGSNPSDFSGDLNRPVESVTWLDATNYCALLTQQDLAAGRIPPGSHYRLPTEAEWECAARAGTTTRFYYSDDPTAASLSSHAWYGVMNGVTTHPVGQKGANPWGLFDMEGNVWEWCQDWYGVYPGGAVTDPQGPDFNTSGLKVIRGGAWDAFDSDCRSARRNTKAVSPFISDDIIGFRIVLAIDP